MSALCVLFKRLKEPLWACMLAPSALNRFSLFSAASFFHFLLASWSGVSRCPPGPQLTSFFLQHLFLFGRPGGMLEAWRWAICCPTLPFYPRSLVSLHAAMRFSLRLFHSTAETKLKHKSVFSWSKKLQVRCWNHNSRAHLPHADGATLVFHLWGWKLVWSQITGLFYKHV